MKGQLEVEAGQLTHQGRVRERNEDFLAAPPSWADEEKLQTKGMLYVVADGMGGHAAGLTASHLAVQRTVQEYYSDRDADVVRSLGRAIRGANDAILEQANMDPAFSGMGTTLVAAVLRSDELLLANVGDSRAYLVRGESIKQISRDHTWVQEQVDVGTIAPEQARVHPKRNVLNRSLGISPDVMIDFFSERLRAGDIVFLCSDGISGPVSDSELLEILVRNKPQDAVKKLVGLANERGGFDNSTAIAIDVLRTPSSRRVVQRPRSSALVPVLGGISGAMVIAVLMIAFVLLPDLTAPPPEVPETATALQPTATVSPTSQIKAPVTPVPKGTPTLPVKVFASPTLSTDVTPAPSITSTPYPAPTLVAPQDGDVVEGRDVTLEWSWDGRLGAEEHFDVRVWQDDEAHESVGRTKEHEYRFDPTTQCHGQCFWTVVVIREQAGDWDDLSCEPEGRSFYLEEPPPAPLEATSTALTSTPAFPRQGRVIDDAGVHLRDHPSHLSAVVDTVSAGTIVTVRSCVEGSQPPEANTNMWFGVEYLADTGEVVTGYMYEEGIELLAAE